MLRRLLINDFKENKLITVSTCVFMTVTAMLLGLSILLFANLYTSIDSLMSKAQTPDFLQMHAGEIDESQIRDFALSRNDVAKAQICTFLNLQNSQLAIGDRSFEGNMQDNGLCCQSESFDYLMDMDNSVIQASEGEVYVPACYRKEYDIQPGEKMRIGANELTVAGFLRDSQMNSMMASSKRFLVNSADYERLKNLGSEEYLIEFKLCEGSDLNAFATDYKDVGLPDNGPTITYPLIKMMNALSDGVMIFVILLVSVVVLLISILCIRYILLTQLEKDRREIGMMKAVGISRKDISRLYMSKYLLLSAVGCFVGIILALIIAGPLRMQMKELYGSADNSALIYIMMVLGAMLTEGIILLSVRRTLRKTETKSAVSILCGRDDFSKKKNLWIPASIITAAAVFMILVPLGMKTTLAAPDFVTYMGIGNSQIRLDVRQMNDIEESTRALLDQIKSDDRVENFSVMQTGSYKAVLPSGTAYNLMIENGDHGRFPVKYIKGSYPQTESDIALSVLNADEMGLQIGDTLIVSKDLGGNTQQCSCTVCGIYSDITNGGKTAKACLGDETDKTPIMWSILYVSLKDENMVDDWISEYQSKHSTFDGGIRATKISDYLQEMYGQTIQGIARASAITIALGGVILMVVILLLMRLVIWRERNDSSLKKALGLTSSFIRLEYMKKAFLYILPGVVVGIFAGVIPGQKLAGLLLGSLGAKGFQFVIDPASTFIFVPAFIFITAGIAAVISLLEVRNIRAFECLYTGTE